MKAIHIDFLATGPTTSLASRPLVRRTAWAILALALVMEVFFFQNLLRQRDELTQRIERFSQPTAGPATAGKMPGTSAADAAAAARRLDPKFLLRIEEALGKTRRVHAAEAITLEELVFDGPSRRLTVRGAAVRIEPVHLLRQELLTAFRGSEVSFPALQGSRSEQNSTRFEMTIHLPPIGGKA